MRDILLDETVVYEQYTEPEPAPVTAPATQSSGGGGGGAAITEITSSTLNVFNPGDGTRQVNAPQAISTSAGPTFVSLHTTTDVNADDDVNAGDDVTAGGDVIAVGNVSGGSLSITNLGTLGQIAVGGGTTIKKIQSGTVNADPASIAAQTRGSVDVTISGLAVGDIVQLQPPDGLNAGLAYAGCRVTAVDTLRIYLVNVTGSAIDDGSLSWLYLHLDIT